MKIKFIILSLAFCVLLLSFISCVSTQTTESSVILQGGDTIALVAPFDELTGYIARELSQSGFSILSTGPNSEFAEKYIRQIDITNPDDLQTLKISGADGILVIRSRIAQDAGQTFGRYVESVRATIFSVDAVGEIIVRVDWRRGDTEYQTERDTQSAIAQDVVRLLLRKMRQQ